MNRAQGARVIAGTVADAIRERMVAYTPVDNPHEALILACTTRQAQALRAHCDDAGLDPGPYLSDTWPKILAAARAAGAAGLAVPSLPEE